MATQAADSRSVVEHSVETTHVDYDYYLPTWEKCRDVISGSDAVKAKGETYLPMLSGQDSDTYEDYKMRALFYGAVKRTVRGMAGMVFMKEPTVEGLPDEMAYLLTDVTFTGVGMFGFAKQLFTEVIGIGRVGLWVDMPKKGSPEMRPYMVMYEAEQILNWRIERIAGRMVTTMVVLSETYNETDPSDPFVVEEYTQFRVLTLETAKDPETDEPIPNARPRYVVRIYRTAEDPDDRKKGGYYIYEETVPLVSGVPLEYIPFICITPDALTFDIDLPPVLDMVEISLSHYRTSADLENGRHWCGTPQPWLAGFPDKTEWQIGGDQIWQTTETSAKAEFLEFRGAGLTALITALEEKESKMAILGMRLLETPKKGAEQPEAIRLRMLGDTSTLQAVARMVGHGLSHAMQWAVSWMMPTAGEDVQIQLNCDFDDEPLSSQDIAGLVSLWQAQAISYRTLYMNLERGELTRDNVEAEDELEEIALEQELFNTPAEPAPAEVDTGVNVEEPAPDEGIPAEETE